MSDSKALAIIPRSLDEVTSLAEVLAKSGLMPDALKGKVPDVVVQILAGQELGLSPMAAIRGVHVVQGKPVLAADTMVALVLGSGLCEYFMCVEDTDTRVTYETKRKGAPKEQRASWSVEDTKRAGLNTKDNWRLYPRSMMKARAKAILARDAYPDVLAGCYDTDEITHEMRGTVSPIVREPDAIDAEIVSESPATDWISMMNEAKTEEDLKALAPQIAKAGLDNGAKKATNDHYKTRLAALRQPAAEPAA